ncbi:MAG: Hint domain-containing protein [Paracoccus sp. (in: a-proteobacteria)]
MVDETGVNFDRPVFSYSADQFSFSTYTGTGFPDATTTNSGTETFSLNAGQTPGEITVNAPNGPLLSDTSASGMTGTGTVNGEIFDGGTFQTETSWDFIAPDGHTYWIAQIVDDTTGGSVYISNYSFVSGETLTFTLYDPSPGYDNGTAGSADDSVYDQIANSYTYQRGMRIDDAAAPGAPSTTADGNVVYVAWDADNVTYDTTTSTFSIDSGATSGTFTTYDNDRYFSDNYGAPGNGYDTPPNDLNQIGDASVGANSFTNQIYQAERILVLTDPDGNVVKVINIQADDGSNIWVSTGEIVPGVDYTIAIDDPAPGMNNPDLSANQEQLAVYEELLIVCFTLGTLIKTDRGEVTVEDLGPGDLVLTKDNGFKPLLWIGRQTVPLSRSEDSQRLRPVRIRAGALGGGLPEQDLYVSQQHRVLVKSKISQRMMGFDEVLIPAKKLLDIEGVDIVTDCDEVTYVHFLFDQHEIVYSNGAETESLFTGPEALRAVSKEAREEILTLFPELTEMNQDEFASTRIIPSGKIAKKLVSRIKKNNKPLYETRY